MSKDQSQATTSQKIKRLNIFTLSMFVYCMRFHAGRCHKNLSTILLSFGPRKIFPQIPLMKMSPILIALLWIFQEFSVIIYSRRRRLHADGKKVLFIVSSLRASRLFLFFAELCFNDFDSSSNHQQRNLFCSRKTFEREKTPKVQ